MIQKLNRTTIFLSILVVAMGLGTLAYLGLYNRYWADDWCYNADFKHQGVLGAVGNYFATGDDAHRGYSTNRYSLTLFSGVLYLGGIFGTQILATLTILLWLGSIVLIEWNLNRVKIFMSEPIFILASALLLFYTLYLSPHRFQILYWRSGILPYSWAIISGLFMLGLIINQLTRERPLKTNLYMIGSVAFISGGFSEIGSALLISGFTILLLYAWWERRKSKEWAFKTYSSILTAWIFLVLALIALAVSPSNSRYGDLDKSPNSLFLVPLLSLDYAFNYIRDSLRSLPIPHLVFFATFVGLGFLSPATGDTKYDIKESSRSILLTVLITLLLVSAIQAPTTYFYTAPPDSRGQSLSRFVILAGMAIVAWVFGATVSQKLGKGLAFMPALLLLICCAYTARATFNVYGELPGFIERAQLWDERDAYIKKTIEQGIFQIEITPIDTKDIDTRDIIRSQDFGKWVTNACGVDYYDVEAMRVTP